MKWKRGVSGNPAGRPVKKPITDALHDLLSQSTNLQKKTRLPKSTNNATALAYKLFDDALKDDGFAATKLILDLVEGRV